MHGSSFTVSLVLAASVAAAPGPSTRSLSFEQRVEAQRAIERVYLAHRIGTPSRSEDAVPRKSLEAKVRKYLKQSAALDKLWNTPIGPEALGEELERMVRQTRMPERLHEIFAALGHDAFVIQECLVRPVLVDRLARAAFAGDARIHAGERHKAEGLRARLHSGAVDPYREHPGRIVVTVVGTGLEQVGEIGAVLEEREAFVVPVVLEKEGVERRLARFVVRKRSWDYWWGEVADTLDPASVEAVASPIDGLPDTVKALGALTRAEEQRSESTCVGDDMWDNGALDGLPDERQGHTAVWTGSQVIVWGGYHDGQVNTGGAYDPATDSWTPISTTDAPSPRERHTAIWTGSVMVVWGGFDDSGDLNTGSRYDPLMDAWNVTSLVYAPSPRLLHTAVWTGSRMIVWGGSTVSPTVYLTTGGRYDPSTNAWLATSTAGAPSARDRHTAVWTGSRMIVWGGQGLGFDTTGGRYDPVSDAWVPTSTVGAPSARTHHTAVWTGSRMVVWGGLPIASTGGRYDAATDSWTPTSTTDVPSARFAHTAVWTGQRMIVWGGQASGGTLPPAGGRYDPVLDGWAPVSTVDAPSGRILHTAVWTGSFMVVWGGRDPLPATGGRYALGQSEDDDGDGLGECQGDCSDQDATAFAVPLEVQNLRWVSPDVLAWDSDASNSGPGTTYDAMRGDLVDVSNFGTGPGDQCLADDSAELMVTDTPLEPGPGQGWFYLVRGNNLCGEGRYETATDGSDRNTTACPASSGPCNCCTPNYTLGCGDRDCEAAVCSFDSYCCRVAWDAICDGAGACACVDCGDCCDAFPNSGLGCDDDACEAIVCAIDPYCCAGWHAGCAALAAEHCTCCGPQSAVAGALPAVPGMTHAEPMHDP